MLNTQSCCLPAELEQVFQAELKTWQVEGKSQKLWNRDATLWTGGDESKWLGWLTIVEEQLAKEERFAEIAEDVSRQGLTHAVLLGMGGSSLCPEVLATTFGRIQGFPELLVLDATDPAQVASIERSVDLARTLFIVASKSGSTLEPNIFKQYFFDKVKSVTNGKDAGEGFVAITDSGSKMQQVAERDRFRRIFFGLPSIGGRYSALSDFGMVPAAIMGIDVGRFLQEAKSMVEACSPSVPSDENPGVTLGVLLGVLALHGRDKVTLTTAPAIRDLGAWLEQLLAESTGKLGKGLIPVDRERLGALECYGRDRVFVHIHLESETDSAHDEALPALAAKGHPVIEIRVSSQYGLGQEFFRWEMATAVAGSIMGINPFDQPDVEASKVATRRLTQEFEQTKSLPTETPFLTERGIALFSDRDNVHALQQSVEGTLSLQRVVSAHLNRLTPGDYFALLAYLEMNDRHEAQLQNLRHLIRDRFKVATCLGFGPRFLHSTGQAYKGGPNSGVFLQITCDDAQDLQIPEQAYTFGIVKAAQARGDFDVLAERKRRVLRVHLGKDISAGLEQLQNVVEQGIGG